MLQVNMIDTIHLPNQFYFIYLFIYLLQTNLGKSEHESLNRDLLAVLGEKWEFDPIIDVNNPFPQTTMALFTFGKVVKAVLLLSSLIVL